VYVGNRCSFSNSRLMARRYGFSALWQTSTHC
jgi:hypothetical protein